MSGEDHVWLPLKVLKTTELAVKVDDGDGNEAWLPRQFIKDWTVEHGEELDETAEGEDLELEIPEWLAEEKELV